MPSVYKIKDGGNTNCFRVQHSQMLHRLSLLAMLLLTQLVEQVQGLSLTSGNCRKNISVKYQVPVTYTRVSTILPQQQQPINDSNENENDINNISSNNSKNNVVQYVEYEDRTRLDTVRICCSGYRAVIFGFCMPICTPACPALSYCAAPNQCACLHGYKASHLAHQPRQPLLCRPQCHGTCPTHSHCVAPNQCACRPGYKDISEWYQRLRCVRVQCPAQRRYDVARAACVPTTRRVRVQVTTDDVADSASASVTDGVEYDYDYGSIATDAMATRAP